MLILMFFLHIVDDFYLQGILAKLKQKDWWKKNAPNPLYRYDYIVGLIVHSFSWAFMIMLPFAIQQHFDFSIQYYVLFGFNVLVHAITDDFKANKKEINLITDQTIHVLQIMLTWVVLSRC
jgi:hypothetical protein